MMPYEKFFDYEKTFDDVTYQFNTPTVSSIDRFLKNAPKGATKAATQLCADSVTTESREAWDKAVAAKPGRAVQVASMLLEELGYGDEGE